MLALANQDPSAQPLSAAHDLCAFPIVVEVYAVTPSHIVAFMTQFPKFLAEVTVCS